MKPIVPPKYDIGIIVNDCPFNLLEVLEPWCRIMYTDAHSDFVNRYIQEEQQRTSTNLKEKIQSIGNIIDYKSNGFMPANIMIEINGRNFFQSDMNVIQQIAEIVSDSGELGEFELGNIKVTINDLKSYEHDLIICK